MASFKYPGFLQQRGDSAFDGTTAPGQPAPFSGIYRCTGCGREIAANAGGPMPPQNHHQHAILQGAIAWQLVVASTHV
jgi:hypothetical protein